MPSAVRNADGVRRMPISHVTRRTGRPYTLVLNKTDALFERERQARSRDEADLEWLTISRELS
jgi:hypothetical protein